MCPGFSLPRGSPAPGCGGSHSTLLCNLMVTYDRASVFGALADSTRRDILDLLRTAELSAGDVADRFPVSRPAVSRHLRVLRRAGLVTHRKEAQSRMYRLRPEALREVDKWLDGYRVFWTARMHDLKKYVEEKS